MAFHPVKRAHACIAWLVILSHTPWDGGRPTWATNETLSRETGIEKRNMRRALADLKSAGLLTAPTGHRPKARRTTGRVLVPALDAPVRVIVPSRDEMACLWSLGRSKRSRPATLVLAAVGAWALACDHHERRMTAAAPMGCSQGDWRALIGVSKGRPWRALVADLEHLEIVQRRGREVWVTPPSTWSPTRIAMRDMPAPTRRVVEPDLPPAPPPEVPPWWGEPEMRVVH